MNKFLNMNQEPSTIIPHFSATPFRISTITATGSLNTIINLKALFDITETINADEAKIGIVYLEYGSNKFECITKGVSTKKVVKTRKVREIKRFDNQATAIIKLRADERYFVNCKIFKNGNIQMTGIKNIDDGHIGLSIIYNLIQSGHDNNIDVVENIEDLFMSDYKIQLINSDFKICCEIKRDVLHRILISEYNLICSYEPCIYPGVKIQYFHNERGDGVCRCEPHCGTRKKAQKREAGACGRITISNFSSGCVIITGANQITHIEKAYAFICKVFVDHLHEIYRKPLPKLIEEEKPKKWVYIKRSSIVNLHALADL